MEDYSFKNYIDFIFDPSHILSDEQLNSLPQIQTRLGTRYTKISANVAFNKSHNMLLLVSNRSTTSIAFRLFFSQEMVLTYLGIDNSNQLKTISFDSNGKLMYSTLENFPEINIKEIDEEMDLYLTMKYLNN